MPEGIPVESVSLRGKTETVQVMWDYILRLTLWVLVYNPQGTSELLFNPQVESYEWK